MLITIAAAHVFGIFSLIESDIGVLMTYGRLTFKVERDISLLWYRMSRAVRVDNYRSADVRRQL